MHRNWYQSFLAVMARMEMDCNLKKKSAKFFLSVYFGVIIKKLIKVYFSSENSLRIIFPLSALRVISCQKRASLSNI